MKLLRIITVALSVIILVSSVVVYLTAIGTKDAPIIKCPTEKIYASVFVTDEELLQYATAKDEQDGDISDRIKVMRKKFFADAEAKTCSITFAVSDSDNNVTTLQRLLVFTDYKSPEIKLANDFIFPAGYTYDFTKYVSANDILDGDLKEQIKIISPALSNFKGTYPVNIKVSNSVGDTVELNFNAIITDEDYFNIKIRLNDYLVYAAKNSEIDYKANIKDIYNNLTTVDADVDDIELDVSGVNMSEAGIYEAYYRLLDDDGEIITLTRLFVVVTEG